MKRKQVTIIVVAFILVVVLYSLPRAVVENDPEMLSSKRQEEQIEKPADKEEQVEMRNPHSADLPAAFISKKNRLENLIASTIDYKKSATFADSLAGMYADIKQYDSSAKYRELALTLDFQNDRLKKTGLAYYEAWTMAVDEGLSNAYITKARSLFDDYLKFDSTDIPVKIRYAMSFVSSENPMKGILMLRDIAESNPDNVEAQFNLGMLSMQTGQYDKAIERLDQVVQLSPGNMQAFILMGIAYMELGENAKSRESFGHVLDHSDDPEVLATASAYLNELK
jgi:tetratricopeptide (TPR) repeat protein